MLSMKTMLTEVKAYTLEVISYLLSLLYVQAPQAVLDHFKMLTIPFLPKLH